MNLLTVCNLFFIYAFCGWCMEVIYSSIRRGKFINRGFLNGPICPIYGVSAVFMSVLLNNYRHNILLVIALSIIIVTLIELVTAIVLNAIFNKVWWDYSKEKLNYKGYICLKFSLMWGVLCAILVCAINPVLFFFLKYLPTTLNFIIVIIFFSIIVLDFIVSILQTKNYTKTLRHIQTLADSIKVNSDAIGSNLSNFTLNTKKKMENMKEKIKDSRFYYFYNKFNLIEKYKNKKD